ncbi:uncharacterized protein LOC123308682 [Coccinella septempunctata]|uniref:uncharacterized protein LOC123308682 n=1 Tax=Coccinella septempunctata TaxID=41139 RepID=UPI001D075247|nr:uncharacterized protein LOC123308682 [Coccinella septempunctata]
MASSLPPSSNEEYSGDLTVNEEVDPIFSMEHKNTEMHHTDFAMHMRKPEHMREFDLNHPDIIFAINLGIQMQAINDVTGTIKPKLKADLQCLVSEACIKAIDKKQVTFCLDNEK